MKLQILKFILFFYTEHIQEDWDEFTKLGKIVLWPAWLVRSILMWIFSPMFIPEYMFKQSKVYQAFSSMGTLTPQQMAEFNKVQTQIFLNNREGRTRTKFKK